MNQYYAKNTFKHEKNIKLNIVSFRYIGRFIFNYLTNGSLEIAIILAIILETHVNIVDKRDIFQIIGI